MIVSGLLINLLTANKVTLEMKKDIKDTINKSLLLNWLYTTDKELPLEELGQWISAKTNGEYMLVKSSKENTTKPLDNIILS